MKDKIVLIFLFLILGMIFVAPETFAEENSNEKWKYDGAVIVDGCFTIGRILLESTGLNECQYNDKLLRVFSFSQACGEAFTQWEDPDTGKLFTYNTTCHHPHFCDDEGGDPRDRLSEYVVNHRYDGGHDIKFGGDVCFGTLETIERKYLGQVNIRVQGQWNHAGLTIETPLRFSVSNMSVFVNNESVEFTVSQDNSERANMLSEIRIDELLKSNEPQIIKIFKNSTDSDPCSSNMIQITKNSDELKIVCVKFDTANKLIERDWTKSNLYSDLIHHN